MGNTRNGVFSFVVIERELNEKIQTEVSSCWHLSQTVRTVLVLASQTISLLLDNFSEEFDSHILQAFHSFTFLGILTVQIVPSGMKLCQYSTISSITMRTEKTIKSGYYPV